ncbi:hypothetical protein PAPYR_1489 [Paratrimastix pyriformis]|uniref:Uncharacterized protein n=1 Tax=Paratrimastix pyriformis TaxID=342808 RepID=A0ABQ8UU01_9EUKA|nr:hypothetical protein PAPYR_1489 [Paratrimastix pyriformis]
MQTPQNPGHLSRSFTSPPPRDHSPSPPRGSAVQELMDIRVGSPGRINLANVGPQYSFGATSTPVRFISQAHSDTEYRGRASPGPAAYNPSPPVQRSVSPSFSFGVRNPNANHMYISPEHARVENLGQFGPGPSYLPNASAVMHSPPQASMHGATSPKVFISRQHSEECRGRDSPGPFAYTPGFGQVQRRTPGYSMAQRTNTGALHLTKEHSKVDRIGAESPGPIYRLTEKHENFTRAKAPSFSFGARFEEGHRFISEAHARAGSPNYGPGPGSYQPEYTLPRKLSPPDPRASQPRLPAIMRRSVAVAGAPAGRGTPSPSPAAGIPSPSMMRRSVAVTPVSRTPPPANRAAVASPTATPPPSS